MATNKPAHTVKLGRVKATIWRNETKFGTRYTVNFSRTYKAQDGSLKNSDSFDAQDLPLIEKLSEEALRWVAMRPEQAVQEA